MEDADVVFELVTDSVIDFLYVVIILSVVVDDDILCVVGVGSSVSLVSDEAKVVSLTAWQFVQSRLGQREADRAAQAAAQLRPRPQFTVMELWHKVQQVAVTSSSEKLIAWS